MRIRFMLVILAIVAGMNGKAQPPKAGSRPGYPGGGVAGNADERGMVIKGKIVDAETNAPMAYANVAVYSQRDSSIAGGMMSGNNGNFEISKLKPGKYFVRAYFVGYDKKKIDNILLIPTKSVVDLGMVALKATAHQLGEVSVTADRARVEFKLDKKVVNVSQEITAAGGSAVEVLENTPSVQTDFDGNVTLRGSSNFTVLIDGKPSVLKGSDALRQIPASNIDNIEIITNPSAKYDPDGDSGIINIVMKKNIKDSFSGLINMTAGVNDKYRGDMNFNYRTGKWNFIVGADFSDMHNKGTRATDQSITSLDTLTTRNTLADGSMINKGKSVKGGFDYQATSSTSFGMTATVGNRDFSNLNAGHQTEVSNYHPDPLYTFIDNNSTRSSNYWSSDANFNHKFNKQGHEIQALLYYSKSDGNDFDYVTHYLTNSLWTPIDANSARNRSNEVSTEKEYRAKIDYTLPISDKNKFEAGYQTRVEKEDILFNFEESTNNGPWVLNNKFTTSFDYTNNIHSLYSTYSHSTEGTSFQLGLRFEYTHRIIGSIKLNEPYKLDLYDFFPTLHLSQKLNHNFELQASYSRRVNRPGGWNLEPFASYMDQYNLRIGNPKLKPEYTNSLELTMLKRINSSFISLEGYFRNTNELMTRIQTLESDGLIYHSMANLNNDYSLGAELMANLEVMPGFRIVASGTLYNYWLKGAINGVNVDQNSTNFDSRLNFDLRLAKNTRLQLNGIYRGKTVSAQGSRDPMWFSNAAVKQDFFKNKLTATLQVNDIFGTMKFQGKTQSGSLVTNFNFKREPQVVQLTLSYKLNNFKMKATREEDANTNNQGGNMNEF